MLEPVVNDPLAIYLLGDPGLDAIKAKDTFFPDEPGMIGFVVSQF